ncbi:PepSY-associated TM helix domain-containing protein [Chitinophaga lutea]|uniref:PepSY-associated TM helix domain-containing protein n=1 Tax=Chitinophaga lutea TaxID=2488634 RepID=UPI00131508D5|nr:PepSY-associated TM helix domain-containing protein [Chitinophaga lutea]
MNKQIFRIHRITGLIAGVFLLLLSFTGSLLVFSDEIDHTLNVTAFHVKPEGPRRPLNELYRTGASAVPGNPYLYFLRLPQAPSETVVMRAEYSADHKIYIYLHPYTGQVLHTRSNKGYFTGALLYLHFTLLSGVNGSIAVMIIGFLIIISLLTGLHVYRKHLLKVLTFRDRIEWKHRSRRWRNLHRVVGVWALLFNLLIVITGILIQFKVVGARVGKKPPSVAVNAPPDFDRAYEVARGGITDFTILGVRPPKKAGDPVVFTGNAGESRVLGEYNSSVSIDPASDTIVKKLDFKTAPLGKKLNASVNQLHFGNFGGVGLKIVYCLLGLTPGIMALSGVLIWWRRKYGVMKRRSGR